MKSFRFSLLSLLTLVTTLFAFAVTDQEMEQARTIAAKYYLRWANDGSGYLDDVKATSMADLNKALKAKEKENIKAFNSVKTPTDYSSWDKAKLVEYWSATFFTSPALSDKGKGARTQVRKKIQAMTISAPAPAAAQPEVKAEPQPEVQPDMPEAIGTPDTITLDPTLVDPGQDILADQNAIEEDMKKNPSLEPEHSYTWLYVAILVLLIGVVIWLVSYAAKVMKHQNDKNSNLDNYPPLDADAASLIASKDEEIKKLIQRLSDEQERSAEASRINERIKVENERMTNRIDALRQENAGLLDTISNLKEQLNIAARNSAKNVERESDYKPAETSAAPSQPAPASNDKEILKVIYLGRANARNIFVRADRNIVPGSTVYRLDTNDGLVGTFHPVSIPAVFNTTLAEPEKWLAGGCIADDFADALGASRFVTDSAGTAIFENGYWKVLRKARIHFE